MALLLPFPTTSDPMLEALVRSGRLSWSGGKPSGAKAPSAVKGPSVEQAVIDDRR